MSRPVYSKMVKDGRITAKLTQRTLAKRVGIKASHIAYIEAGRRKPSLDLVMRLARALRLNALALATESHPVLKKIIASAEKPA
jgi:DNA-binding XRE family transcriptional regulator